ncbi:cysteine proteinase inhibitor 1-like [Carica papaya]|uniref:cysteine proteinase inhibitor 1-like n=1 Tax=Carica papaya TaxID=3649 RepID=UPI000B8CDD0C|nr:cysteine proteinase inhibitor 1-like [Carica papaya]
MATLFRLFSPPPVITAFQNSHFSVLLFSSPKIDTNSRKIRYRISTTLWFRPTHPLNTGMLAVTEVTKIRAANEKKIRFGERNTEKQKKMKGSISGGITDVEGNANSLEFQNLARFAVDEHNRKENALLQFKKIVNVKQQVVGGMRYYITLEASDGHTTKVYQAKVWVRLWENFRSLEEFTLLGDAN